jgi:hypothetical protein
MGHAKKERVSLFGTDQRITSGPAAKAAASPRRQSSTRKQAEYMAAPERFAKRQILLTPRAPSIHGPSPTFYPSACDSRFRGEAEVGRDVEFVDSVENDPFRQFAACITLREG